MVTLVAFIALAPLQSAQTNPTVEAMKKIEWMVGDWVGTGWQESGGKRTEYKAHEIIEKKAGGAVIVDTLKHWIGDEAKPEKVVFEGFGVFRYDENAKTYEFVDHFATGGVQKNTFQLVDGKLVSTLEAGITLEVSVKDGVWTEVATREVNGKKTPFFGLSMKRQGAPKSGG